MGHHAVLGANGAIGRATLEAFAAAGLEGLAAAGLDGRPLTRATADAMDSEALTGVLAGADVVYHCVGLPYEGDLWMSVFPAIS